MQKHKLHDFVLFNFLAKDKENALDIIDAGNGYVVPGIVASDYEDIDKGVQKVQELKEVADVISIGLGGGGDPDQAEKVVEIASLSNPGHINQPFESAAHAKGFLEGKGVGQLVNALVKPSGDPKKVQLVSGVEIHTEIFLDIAKELGIESIKFMPLNGETHLKELVYLTKIAAQKGIRGVEPAGGIHSGNIKKIIESVQNIDIEFFMTNIFGSTIDNETGRTIPEEVNKIIKTVEGL